MTNPVIAQATAPTFLLMLILLASSSDSLNTANLLIGSPTTAN
jgi:hypothetical protein